jgi:hypothetical protein
MSLRFAALAGSVSLALAAGAIPTDAAAFLVSGYGTWISSVPSTPYSQAGEAYSFSFDLAQNFTPDWYSSADIAATTQFTNFRYYLNGVLVPGAPQDIAFFDASLMGGLQLAFVSDSVEFIGPPVAINFGQPMATLVLGQYSEYPNMNYALDANGVPLNQGINYGFSIVPEPAAWAMALTGLFGVGAVVRQRRRAHAA